MIVRSSWPCFFVCFRWEPRLRTRQRALRSPFGNLRPITSQTIWYPTLAGRGGSVSRRDHNQANRRYAQLTGGTTYAEVPKPNASYSSGEGVWGRGASLREAASPPESPHPTSFIRRKLVFRAFQARGGGFPIAPATPSARSLLSLYRM